MSRALVRAFVSPFVVTVCLNAAPPAAAQPPSRAGVFVNVNAALQDGPQNLALSVPTAPVFGEDGTIDVDDRIDGATLLDFFGGVRGRRFLFGAGYFRTRVDQSHEFSASTIPPSAGSFKRSLNGITPALEHRESVVYLSAGVTRTVTEKFDFAVSAGPAFFKVRQELPESIVQTDDFRGEFLSMATRSVDETGIGFQAALDLNYLFHPRIGIGSVVRYSRATADLPDSTESMTLGGFLFGAGARFRF